MEREYIWSKEKEILGWVGLEISVRVFQEIGHQ